MDAANHLEASGGMGLNVLMSFWTAIVMIVAIVFVAEIVRATVKEKKGASKRDAALEAKVKALEERIASLESIAVESDREAKFRDLV